MNNDLYDGFWRFAIARQNLMVNGFTTDPILCEYKFTNCYRACDRVSQYLIKNIIYLHGNVQPLTPEQLIKRIFFFKLPNRIDTWERICEDLGHEPHGPTEWENAIERIMAKGHHVYTCVFRHPVGRAQYGEPYRYKNHGRMVDFVIASLESIMSSESLEDLYLNLVAIPMLGPFLAMQFAIDLNYSELFNFDENEWVQPGPGSRRGVCKVHGCAYREVDRIRDIIRETQEDQWSREFPMIRLGRQREDRVVELTPRPLSLMDIQNLYCEYDKYLRIARPDLNAVGRGNRKPMVRPKQRYEPAKNRDGTPREKMIWPDSYFFPPKWVHGS